MMNEADLSNNLWLRLEQLVQPKRPNRGPIIASALISEDLENFSRAIEDLADGNFEATLTELKKLSDKHPSVTPLRYAVAATLLAAGRTNEAYEIFADALNSGADFTSDAYWNFSCVFVRLRDRHGAVEMLTRCSQTEYKTKPELWLALKTLSNVEPVQPISRVTKAPVVRTELTPSQASSRLTDNLPVPLREKRIEILRRLVLSRLIPKAYRPDLLRLQNKDRQRVAELLDAAHRGKPEDASSLLVPLCDAYPDLYTVKVHAAAFLIRDGDFDKAQRLLEDGRVMRPLDLHSRFNLAFLYLQSEQPFERLLDAFDESKVTPSADFRYWLALSITYALCRRQHNAANCAGRALQTLKSPNPNIEATQLALKAAEIQPSQSMDNPEQLILVAQKALSALSKDDIQSAVQVLTENQIELSQIAELGQNVLTLRFEARPSAKWLHEKSRQFEHGVELYQNASYDEAIKAFSSMSRHNFSSGIALNLIASHAKANDKRSVAKVAQTILRRRGSGTLRWDWQIAYNLSLAHYYGDDISNAISTAERYRNLNQREFTRLLITLYSQNEINNPDSREQLSVALNALKGFFGTPSRQYLFILARVMLTKPNPDVALAQEALLQIVQQKNSQALLPAVEVTAMQQVRTAFETFLKGNLFDDGINYMQTILETKAEERQIDESENEVIPQRQQLNIGLTFTALVCLARLYHARHEHEKALGQIFEAETLLNENRTILPIGFRTKDWKELMRLAAELSLSYPALYYLERVREDEPEDEEANQLKIHLETAVDLQATQNLEMLIESISQTFATSTNLKNLSVTQLLQPLEAKAPLFTKRFRDLFQTMRQAQSNADFEDQQDTVIMLASMELPRASGAAIQRWLDRLNEELRQETVLDLVEIDIVSERIIPRMDDREATCLLRFTSPRAISTLSITDALSESLIWEGQVAANKPYYARWTVYREEGFPPEDYVDLRLSLSAQDDGKRIASQVDVSGLTNLEDLETPDYPTGALDPNNDGEELYGRADMIQTITRSLGRKRTNKTHFLEAPRQMGKTSLLNFVKKHCPDHVLPVYINLELSWSTAEPANLWNFLVQRLREEAGERDLPTLTGQNYMHLYNTVNLVCESLGKLYVLFMLDEFHTLFKKLNQSEVNDVLAQFRDFLNDARNRISLLIADRYTIQELESEHPHDYWGQLSPMPVAPLDFESTRRALELPARGKDFSLLPETIESIYTLTGGYPYHVQRVANYLLEKLYEGPWLVALPEDVKRAEEQMIEQDRLFQIGLCRPDRIDSYLANAITSLLEWRDMCAALPVLVQDSSLADAPQMLKIWSPKPKIFLAHFPDRDRVMNTLCAIGILRQDGAGFFSPLLESWLLKMRRTGRTISGDTAWIPWQISTMKDGATLSAREWQNLDAELVKQTKLRDKPPLRERATRADDWDGLVAEVKSEDSFKIFINILYKVFIEDRDEKRTMMQFPWLFWVYHRIRLVRNYVIHSTNNAAAVSAWDYVCMRALGRDRTGYVPMQAEEWRALQITLLRSLCTALQNATEIAQQPELTV